MTAPDTTARPLRVDARRNRDAILRAARDTFETEGVLASLDGIARRARVGNATLYRNFPSRDDLLVAVMQGSIEAALAEAEDLNCSHPPREALAEWLIRLAWRLRIWHDLPYCLATARADSSSSMRATTNPLVARTGALLAAAQESGDVCADVAADELFELVTALSWAVDRLADDELAARKRVQMATRGLFT